MAKLYVDGKQVGTVTEGDTPLRELLAERRVIELQDDSGATIGTVVGAIPEPLCPWEPTLTREELDRRSKQGGMSLAEFWKRMGVQ